MFKLQGPNIYRRTKPFFCSSEENSQVQKKTKAPTTKRIPKGECLTSPKNYSHETSRQGEFMDNSNDPAI
jgi:hypothetical protein